MELVAILAGVLAAVWFWRQILILFGVSVLLILVLGCVYLNALLTSSLT